MKIKTFIFIFLIFSQNFIFIIKSCEMVSIDRRDYKLSGFDKGLDMIQDIVGNKKVMAFNYNFFHTYRNNVKADFFTKIESILKEEKRKLTPHLFHYILDKIIPDDRDESKFNDVSRKMSAFEGDKIIEKLKEYKTIKEEYSSFFPAVKKTAQNGLIGGAAYLSLKTILPILSEKLLKSELPKLTLSNPYTASIFFGVFFIIDLGSKIYNWRIDCGIQKYKNEIYKSTELFFSIKEQIKKLEWIGNNMVLTAKSKDESCANFASKFDYYDGIKYTNPIDKELYMVNLTCALRSDTCNNYIYCLKNLIKYMKCKKEGNREIEDCPIFMDDCSLIYI